MNIDYNKLKSFLAVVRYGSVTAAARELHRTQSAVSQTLRGLEQHLGLKLIEWEGKRLKLTRDGQLVYKAVNDRMAAIDEQLATIITADKEIGGCIEIGVLHDQSTNIQQLLLTTIAKFRSEYPSVIFKIHFGTSTHIEQALLEQQLDIGLLINFRERHRFKVFEVTAEEHIIVTSPEYLKKSRPFDTVKDVISSDLIDIDENLTCFAPWVQRHDPISLKLLEERNPVIAVPDFSTIRELVLAEQGVAVIPRYLIEDDLACNSLIQVLPELSPLQVGLDCAVERGHREHLCERLFIEKLREAEPSK